MGLDMYLSAEKYIGGWEHCDEEQKSRYNAIKTLTGLPPGMDDQDSRYLEVDIVIGYWRKANAIHAWFVTHCGEGRDDCQTMYVDREKLAGLKQTCEQLLASRDPEEAVEALPPIEGFFFGGTDIDDWYWEGLQETVDQVTKALSLDDSWSINYRASW